MNARVIGLILGVWFVSGSVAPALAESASPINLAIDTDSPGAKLYQQRCSVCHDQPSGRVPPRITLLAMTPEYVVRVLTNGPMQPQAAGLSQDEIRTLAQYVTGKPFGSSPEPDPQANMCKRPAPALQLSDRDWNGWGRDLDNSRFQPHPGLKAADVPRLQVKWAFAYPGNAAYAPPTAVGDRVFVSSIEGRLFALDAKTGCTYWSFDAGAALKSAPTVARAKQGNGYVAYFVNERSLAFAVDASSGKLLWQTKVDEHPVTRSTGSPLFYKGRLYVPVASNEELGSRELTYPCCTFRGSLVALDGATGKMIWKSFTIDQEAKPFTTPSGRHMSGPAGAGIWTTITVDPSHKELYFVTGNSYTEGPNPTTEALIAFDLDTGVRKWAKQVQSNDNWTTGCWKPKNENCPPADGPDNDLTTTPVLRTLQGGNRILITAQKSGIMYGLDPDRAGALVWQMAPAEDDVPTTQSDNSNSGILYGLAADTTNVYAARIGQGGVTAFSIATGKQAWRTPSPNVGCSWGKVGCTNAQANAPIVIPGAVFAGSHDGHIRAYATDTGRIIWDFDTAVRPYEAVNGVPASGGTIAGSSQVIANGMLYVNSGYVHPHSGNALIAFSVDGK